MGGMILKWGVDIPIWSIHSQHNQKLSYVAIFYFFIRTFPKTLLAKFKDF